jgi:hypothetical protein
MPFAGMQSFIALPTGSQESRATTVKCRSVTGHVFANLAQGHETTNRRPGEESATTVEPKTTAAETRSVKSWSSVKSFKSAVSEQSIIQDFDFSHEIKEVKGLIHAFRMALDILGNLIERRIQDRKTEVYLAAKDLGASLASGEKEVGRTHKRNCVKFGKLYVVQLLPILALQDALHLHHPTDEGTMSALKGVEVIMKRKAAQRQYTVTRRLQADRMQLTLQAKMAICLGTNR